MPAGLLPQLSGTPDACGMAARGPERAAMRGAGGLLAALLWLTPAQAQAQPAPGQPVPGQATAQAAPQAITLDAGTGRLIQLPRPAAAVLAAEPRIARVQPVSPTSLFVMGAEAGRTTIIATNEDGVPVAFYEVTVQPGRSAPTGQIATGVPRGALPPAGPVQAAIRSVLRGAGDVRVASAGQGYVLTGTVPTAQDAYRAEAVARSFAGEDRQVLNEIAVLSSIQVNLRVRVAEVSREVTREIGFNWAAFANSGQWVLGFQSFLPIGSALAQPSTASIRYRSSVFDINALIDSLAQDRIISVLAEPNLTAQSGETASFLAGGEFPIPVATTQTGQISIEFKQFGVSLAFVPTVLGPDRLNLRVRPEVSELSQNGAIEVPIGLGGTVRIPAITVRRAETTVELGSGQSFAIAGLLQRATDQTEQGTIGLQDLPVLGALFRSDRFRRAETELVIIVTPYIVRPVSEPARLAAPTDTFRPATDLERIIERRQLGRVRPGASRTLDAGFIVE
ncbi:MAG: hypothetical protein RLZZ187_2078 [Pseudomonadota bacterium]